jgi:hypothetical protein
MGLPGVKARFPETKSRADTARSHRKAQGFQTVFPQPGEIFRRPKTTRFGARALVETTRRRVACVRIPSGVLRVAKERLPGFASRDQNSNATVPRCCSSRAMTMRSCRYSRDVESAHAPLPSSDMNASPSKLASPVRDRCDYEATIPLSRVRPPGFAGSADSARLSSGERRGV